jgi:hypothetical protein
MGWQKESNEVEEQLVKEIRGVLEYLLEVHGLAPGRKVDGVTRLIYANLNGLQSTLSRLRSWRRCSRLLMIYRPI